MSKTALIDAVNDSIFLSLYLSVLPLAFYCLWKLHSISTSANRAKITVLFMYTQMHARTQTRTQTLIRSPVIFYLALQKRSVNWFIIFAVVHFKLQLQEMTSDEKLIGLSDTVMARRYKRRLISFCTNDWGGIIFPLVSILTHPTVKGCRQCHRQKTDSIFTGFIYIYILIAIPFGLTHSLQPATVILNDMTLQFPSGHPYIGLLYNCSF